MNMIKKSGLATAILLTSNLANAAVYDLFSIAPLQQNVGMTLVSVTDAGAFTDYFNFTLVEPIYSMAGIFDSLLHGTEDTAEASFTSLNIIGDHVVYAYPSISNGTPEYHADYLIDSMDNSLFIAGDYTIELSGIANVSGANYGVIYGLATASHIDPASILNAYNVSAVPEPSSIALMLGGLGLVGFMAARRHKKLSM